jgi:hypothetical protein
VHTSPSARACDVEIPRAPGAAGADAISSARMSEDVTSAYGSEDASRGRADVSEPGIESQNVTDFPETALQRTA